MLQKELIKKGGLTMSKALVIKNADFSANRVDRIDILPDIPCTGITLDQASASITDSVTLTATPTPAKTTDNIIWTSSDTRIATVDSGLVKAVSNGTAIITATCGNYSASCTVIVAIPLAIAKGHLIQVGTMNSGTTLGQAAECGTSNKGIAYGSSIGRYPVAGSKYSGDINDIYPISIPKGATAIDISTSSNYAAIIVYFDKDTPYQPGDSAWPVATVLDGQTATGGTNWSIASWEYGNKEFAIPSDTNINGFTLGISAVNQTAYNNFTENVLTYAFKYEND